MNIIKTCFKLQKYRLTGLCFTFILFFTILGATSMTLVACGTDKDITAQKDSVLKDSSSVVILKSTDIPDYA